MTDTIPQFSEHLRILQARHEKTLQALQAEQINIEAILIHSGIESHYFGDDIAVPFRPYGHFAHWLPIRRPDQMVMIRPGECPRFYRVQPDTCWCETTIPLEPEWESAFEIIDLASAESVIDHLPPSRHIAFLGESVEFAKKIGIPSTLHNNRHLRNRLDYHRSLKTPYEVDCIRQANVVALRGHEAARDAFFGGSSEWDIHQAYLGACGAGELDMPYENIVALGDKGAILHYQYKRRTPGTNQASCMIDAGFSVRGYASDITRTHPRETAPSPFIELIAGVDAIKETMVNSCRPGMTFKDLNEQAHEQVAELLGTLNLIHGTPDAWREKQISKLFLPHGLGHFLGLQVHDVSGLFKDETGILEPPREEHKELRLTRTLEPGMVLTIEPGIYFIPHLIDGRDAAEQRELMNLDRIHNLYPYGGVREEDNILITESGATNITAEAKT